MRERCKGCLKWFVKVNIQFSAFGDCFWSINVVRKSEAYRHRNNELQIIGIIKPIRKYNMLEVFGNALARKFA